MVQGHTAFVDCHGDVAERLTNDVLCVVPGIDVLWGEPADEDELITRLAGRRHALVYMAYLSGRVLRACPDLRTVAYLATGISTHADMDAVCESGIRFEGVKGFGDRAVAEHAVALAFAALKRICEMDRGVRANRWRLMRTEEFAGKTFGILGLGGIGRETARIAHALGARVVGWTRSADAKGAPVELLPFKAVLARSDILSLHLELNQFTEGFIGREAFSLMKPGMILVNTARAGLIEETALFRALGTGIVSHAALDVFHREPLPYDSVLRQMGNVTLTPHSAWLTKQAIDRLLIAGFELLAKHVSES